MSDTLIAAARDAATRAYAPYSNFQVGAAVLLADGSVVTGANVENASYGLSLCAETVALAKIANEGRLAEVTEIAVIGGTGSEPVRPCGRCRQFLNEAAQLGGRDITIHCSAGNGRGGRTASAVRAAALCVRPGRSGLKTKTPPAIGQRRFRVVVGQIRRRRLSCWTSGGAQRRRPGRNRRSASPRSRAPELRRSQGCRVRTSSGSKRRSRW